MEKTKKNEHMNVQTTKLKFIFGIMDVTDTTTISLDNEEFGGEIFEKSKQIIYKKMEFIE